MLVTNALFFGVCLWVLALVHSWWATVLVAAVLGFASGQLGFQLHDSGHRQMFSNRRGNTLTPFLTGNGPLGKSQGWWVGKHNRHPGHPHHQDLHPGIPLALITHSAERGDGKAPP